MTEFLLCAKLSVNGIEYMVNGKKIGLPVFRQPL